MGTNYEKGRRNKIVLCKNCGKEIFTYNSQPRIYCSKSCQYKSMNGKHREFCPNCNKKIITSYYGYCSKLCFNNIHTKKHKEYVKNHKNKIRDYNIKQHKEIREKWGSLGQINNVENSKRMEKYAENILTKEGFGNLLNLTELNRFFSGDFIGTKNNKNYLIEVTGTYNHKLKNHIKICNRLNLKLIVLFIKPDYSSYKLKEFNLNSSNKHLSLTREEIWLM